MDANEGKDIKNELKIIVIGNSNTGKTSFVNKWTKGTFTDFYKATVVSEFSYKIYQHKDKFYRIQLWDLAGQDQNTHITKIFSKNSHGCVVLCDITNKDSLNDTLKWKESVDESTRFIDGGILPSILVENKIDLVEEDVVKEETEIKQFAEENKLVFYETSALNGNNIEEIFVQSATELVRKLEAGELSNSNDTGIKVFNYSNNDQNKKKKSGCC